MTPSPAKRQERSVSRERKPSNLTSASRPSTPVKMSPVNGTAQEMPEAPSTPIPTTTVAASATPSTPVSGSPRVVLRDPVTKEELNLAAISGNCSPSKGMAALLLGSSGAQTDASEDDPKALALRALEASKQKKIIQFQAPKAGTQPAAEQTGSEMEPTAQAKIVAAAPAVAGADTKSGPTSSATEALRDAGGVYRYTKKQLEALSRDVAVPASLNVEAAGIQLLGSGGMRAGSGRMGSSRGGRQRTGTADARSGMSGRGDRRGSERSDRGGSRRGDRRGGRRDLEEDESSGSRAGSHRGSDRPVGARGIELLAEDLRPLEKSETAWAPELGANAEARRRDLSQITAEDGDEAAYVAAVEKRTRGLLNKLSPSNFEKLKPQFIFKAQHLSALQTLCDLLVAKSFDEPKYASLYASLTLYVCHNVVVPEGIDEDQPENRTQIRGWVRKTVISACQRQFENRPRWSDKSTGKITEEEFEEVVKIKTKALGNMRFVAELYNFGIISKKVMVMIIYQLLSNVADPTEEDIECALMLLNTIASNLERTIEANILDHWFSLLDTIKEHPKLLSRLKFAIVDLFDLRNAQWVKDGVVIGSQGTLPGKAGGAPPSAPSSAPGTPSGSRQNSSRGRERNAPCPEGWIKSPSASSSGRRRDSTKLLPRQATSAAASANQMGSARRRLGRTPAGASVPGSSRTSGSSAPRAAGTPKMTANVFDLLHQLGEEDHDDEQAAAAEEEKEGSESEDAEVESDADDKATTAEEKKVEEELSEEQVRARAESIMQSTFNSKNAEDFAYDFRFVRHHARDLLSRMMGIVCEAKEAEAVLFGQCLAKVVDEGYVSGDEVVGHLAASEVVEFYDDIKVDVPLIDKLMTAVLKELSKAQTDVDVSHLSTRLGLSLE